MSFKGRLIFRQYTANKYKHFDIKFTNLVTQWVTHDMKVSLGKYRNAWHNT
jgi:hypothetical protein